MDGLIRYVKKNWKNILLVVLFLLVVGQFFGFGRSGFLSVKSSSLANDYVFESSNFVGRSKSVGMSASDSYSGIVSDSSKKIRSADITLESDNYDASISSLRSFISNRGLILLRENEFRDNKGYRTSSFVIKCNNKDFLEVISQVKSFGEVKYLQVVTEDQSKRYNDYSKRIERLEKQMRKYEEMLDRNDLKVEDEIKIQNRINSLEDSIFYIKNQMSDIDYRAKMSEIRLTIREKKSYSDEVNFVTFKEVTKIVLDTLNSTIIFIIRVITFIIPYLFIYLVYLLGRFGYRFLKGRIKS